MELVKPFEPDVKKALKQVLKVADQFQGVIIIGLYKDGTQYCLSSTMTHPQRCFLKCFFDQYILRWFEMEEDG